MCLLWIVATFFVASSVVPAASEICTLDSVPKVRFCSSEEFCCGNGCCPRTMISFFKLAIGVVLLVMVIVWFCSYMRRGRGRESSWLRTPAVTPPPPYTLQGAVMSRGAMDPVLHFPGHPSRAANAAPAPPPAPPEDLPPPYHTVVNVPLPPSGNSFVPPPYLPVYDGMYKAANGPT